MTIYGKEKKEVKDLEDWAAVHRVYGQTKSKRATASILGISRNTVKRMLSMTETPVYHRTKYSIKIDQYKEQIIEWRCEPYNFNGEYSCAMKSHFRKFGNQMSGRRKSSYARLLA